MTGSQSDAFGVLAPLISATGSPLAPEDFHAQVNVAFHDAEAVHYDTLHADLWHSLRPPIEALSRDALAALPATDAGYRLLDIGCGTGLASTLLLETPLGRTVGAIDAIDTSTVMLDHCRRRASDWRPTSKHHLGTIEQAPHGPFDIVITCSVLHHIPDLGAFLAAVAVRQAPGGVFIHLQDPNARVVANGSRSGRALDPEIADRFAAGAAATKHRQQRARWERFTPTRLVRALGRRLRGRHESYIDTINQRLLAAGVVRRAMTSDELWSVTDIHCEGLPYSHGRGISIDELAVGLPGYERVSLRSYGFFGPLESDLPRALADRERALAAAGDLDGGQLAAVWRRRR